MNDTTAAHEAATIEAMHTGGAIPSPLWTENQRLLAVAAELREQLAAAVQRTEAAEEDVRRLLTLVREYSVLQEQTQRRVDAEKRFNMLQSEQIIKDAARQRAELAAMRERAEAAEAEREDFRVKGKTWMDAAERERQRAEAAEAKLAAVPMNALLRIDELHALGLDEGVMAATAYYELHDWLEQRMGEVQP